MHGFVSQGGCTSEVPRSRYTTWTRQMTPRIEHDGLSSKHGWCLPPRGLLCIPPLPNIAPFESQTLAITAIRRGLWLTRRFPDAA